MSFAQIQAVGGRRLRPHAGYTDDGHQRITAGRLTFDSTHRHKGMQAPAVLLADVDYLDWREEPARNTLYTAMPRVGLHLTILDPGKNGSAATTEQTNW